MNIYDDVHREMDLSTAPLKLTATNLRLYFSSSRRLLSRSLAEKDTNGIHLDAPALNEWQQQSHTKKKML